MPRYIDAETIPDLFNEKFKETRKLIEAGETQLDNLAEGFTEAEKIVLFKAPTADVQKVRRGVWLPILESEITGWNPEFAGRDPVGGYICSICKNEAIYSCNDELVLSDFCPYCGAKMDGGGKDSGN